MIWIALGMIALRLQCSVHSLKIGRPDKQSSRLTAKHCSALWWSAVSSSAKRRCHLFLALKHRGHVEAIGNGVTDLSIGDAVAWISSIGSYAEKTVVPADRLVKVLAGGTCRTPRR
jgi:hypothetical protein